MNIALQQINSWITFYSMYLRIPFSVCIGYSCLVRARTYMQIVKKAKRESTTLREEFGGSEEKGSVEGRERKHTHTHTFQNRQWLSLLGARIYRLYC